MKQFLQSAKWPVYKKWIVVAGIIGAIVFVFIEFSSEVIEGETMAIDAIVLKSLRMPDNPAVPAGPKWLLISMQDISALGGRTILVLITTAVAGYFAIRKKMRMTLFFVCSIAGGSIAMSFLKAHFARPRPDVVPHLATVLDASYPSGHSMLSAIVYLTLGALLAKSTPDRYLKVYYFSVAIALTVLIGFSRVYLGVHYPTDVIAGWSAGVFWAAATYLAATWIDGKQTD